MYEQTGYNNKEVSYVMRVSAVFRAAARCCNTANSSSTIGVKFKIINKRIGSVQNGLESSL